jgi:hypothetical protein
VQNNEMDVTAAAPINKPKIREAGEQVFAHLNEYWRTVSETNLLSDDTGVINNARDFHLHAQLWLLRLERLELESSDEAIAYDWKELSESKRRGTELYRKFYDLRAACRRDLGFEAADRESSGDE